MRTSAWVICVGGALLGLGAGPAIGQVSQPASVCAGAGGRATNATLQAVSAAGQAGAVAVTSDNRYVHYAGFLGAVALRPAWTNAAGLALEAAPDDDRDGLRDGDEVGGAAFAGLGTSDPNNPDSDGDGMGDGAEAEGGFDPRDARQRLAIVGLAEAGGGGTRVTWVGRGGGAVQAVLAGPRPVPGACTTVVHRAAYAGGPAPWFPVTNTVVIPGGGANPIYYRVKLER